jgi:hypothetical protein
MNKFVVRSKKPENFSPDLESPPLWNRERLSFPEGIADFRSQLAVQWDSQVDCGFDSGIERTPFVGPWLFDWVCPITVSVWSRPVHRLLVHGPAPPGVSWVDVRNLVAGPVEKKAAPRAIGWLEAP